MQDQKQRKRRQEESTLLSSMISLSICDNLNLVSYLIFTSVKFNLIGEINYRSSILKG